MQSTVSRLDQHVNSERSHASLDTFTSTYNDTRNIDETRSNGQHASSKGKGKARAVADTDGDSGEAPFSHPCGFCTGSSLHGGSETQSFDISSDSSATDTETEHEGEGGGEGQEEEPAWCLICHTSPISDRTVLPQCLHSQFCFACILRWIGIKRKCPLCQCAIGDHVIHAIRNDNDYVRYHLPPPLSTRSASSSSAAPITVVDRSRITAQVQRVRNSRSHRRTASSSGEDDFAHALARRSEIYRLGLYAAHVGSNRHTNYRACPTPAQIRHSVSCAQNDMARRITTFVRRELLVWPHLDVDFLTNYILSLLQVFGICQDETVRLVGEFLGERTARHLLHELECFLRSGKRELRFYDTSPWLQYGAEILLRSTTVMDGGRGNGGGASWTGTSARRERGRGRGQENVVRRPRYRPKPSC